MNLLKKNKLFVLIGLVSLLLSQDSYEGYTLFTPGGGGGATTYLKDNSLNNIQTWSHSNGAASMPYLISGDEPGWENTLLIYPYRVSNPTMENGGVGGAVDCLTILTSEQVRFTHLFSVEFSEISNRKVRL